MTTMFWLLSVCVLLSFCCEAESREIHEERGELACGLYHGGFPKTEGVGIKYTEIPVTFKKRFIATPIVQYSVNYVDANAEPTIRYFVDVKSTTREGFTFKCGTWSTSLVHSVKVVWVAFYYE